MPMMYLAHVFQRPLEEHFTIVHWDQRASGKSYLESTDPETINVRQFLDDTEYLVRYLTKRFGKDKVILVGHSWGTYLGSIFVSRNPDLIEAYISVGQVVDYELEKDAQRRFLLKEATERNDPEAMKLIKNKGSTVFEEFLFKYGGELSLSKSYYPLIWAGVRAEEYNLRDVMHVAKGSAFCSSNMVYNVLPNRSILKDILEYKVPIYFFTGRHDMTTPAALIEDYFEEIDAPDKKLIWFQRSAHFPFFEEPDKFCSEFIELLK
jgi:pimeloyl-ACP methyl ester carboxylesterase